MRTNEIAKMCPECGDLFATLDDRKVYCTRTCAAKSNNRKRDRKPLKQCRVCGQGFQDREGQRFCSKHCRDINLISEWHLGIWDGSVKSGLSSVVRRWCLWQAGYQCTAVDDGARCTWDKVNPKSGKTTLQVDHRDGNCYNNTRENLQVLCPNHHSMTLTYGALNKGFGRKSRQNNP